MAVLQEYKCPYCDNEFETESLAGYDAGLSEDGADDMQWDTSPAAEPTTRDPSSSDSAEATESGSCGSSISSRAFAHRRLPTRGRDAETGGYYPGRVIIPELTEDLRRVFRLLIAHGADKSNTSTYSKKSIREHYENESVWKICGIFWEE